MEGEIVAFCTALTALPEGLVVQGSLVVSVTPITVLPDGLVVHGDLGLRDCEDLLSLPVGMSVGGEVHLSGCRNISTIPGDWLNWGPMVNGEPHQIRMGNTGFTATEEARAWLRHCDVPNLNFDILALAWGDDEEEAPTVGFPDVGSAVAFWCETAGEEAFAVDATELHEAEFKTFLARLRGAKEFVIQELRRPWARAWVDVLRDERKVELLACCAERWLCSDCELSCKCRLGYGRFQRGSRGFLAWFAVADALERDAQPALWLVAQWMRV